MEMTLLRGGELYAPEPAGHGDVLIVGERVARAGGDLGAFAHLDGVTVRDVSGLRVVPGFIDQHVHVTGGGGGGGFVTRGPEVMLTDLTRWGITTVVGITGTDGTTRTPIALLAKIRALEAEGLSAYMWTGAYGVPLERITMSTDGNGVHSFFAADGSIERVELWEIGTLYEEVRDLVRDEKLPLEQAILTVALNVARLLRLDDRKGRIRAGADADLVLLDPDLRIAEVYARGRRMLEGGQPVVRGWFEGKNHSTLPRG